MLMAAFRLGGSSRSKISITRMYARWLAMVNVYSWLGVFWQFCRCMFGDRLVQTITTCLSFEASRGKVAIDTCYELRRWTSARRKSSNRHVPEGKVAIDTSDRNKNDMSYSNVFDVHNNINIHTRTHTQGAASCFGVASLSLRSLRLTWRRGIRSTAAAALTS